MNIIKTLNKRDGGYIYHYAHFLCDCLFPEIINGFNKFDIVYRKKIQEETIGNFNIIYQDVTDTKSIEIDSNEFDKIKCPKISPPKKENLLKLKYINYFRNVLFLRYDINPIIYNKNYPEILLIKRGDRINLVDKSLLKKNIDEQLTTGKERREIKNIDVLEKYIENICGNKFKSMYFEQLEFKEQLKYFNNAKIIICAHGAVMSNMFFCKKNATIIEITCNTKWIFFDKLSNILSLNHIKINDNNFISIKNVLDKIITNYTDQKEK